MTQINEEKTIKSYYHYPLRSLRQNKRAYLLLALSIFSMVVLCASVLIYYASRYEADVETLRREYGPQHTVFYDIAPEEVPQYTNRGYVERALTPELYASAENPDILADFSQVFFTRYTEEFADFFSVALIEGRMPEAFGEIIVSEDAERYFPCFTLGEEQSVDILTQAKYASVPFRVVGVFSSASAASQYVLCGDETADYLMGSGSRGYFYTDDVYLIFRGNSPTAAKRGMQRLISDLAMKKTDEDGNEENIYYEERNDMLSEVALVRPFYESNTMQLMFLFSVLPAAIALTVFIYLDMQKNLGELATLSMIGATWKQIFRMQMLKYGMIFCGVFPLGTLAAAGLMALVCAFTNRISPDRVFLWFRFDPGSILFLLFVCAGILILVVWLLAKRMTAVAHSEMMSAVHASGNIFVAKTSDLLFADNHITERIALLFFTRNRKINRLFCLVVILLFCIYSFFTMQITREYGAAPDAQTMDAADFLLAGDREQSIIYDSISADLKEELEAVPHIESVRRSMEVTDFYYIYEGISVSADIKKQIVSNDVKDGKFGTDRTMRVWKRGNTDTLLLGLDPELLLSETKGEVVDGDLMNIFDNENQIALVVHGWSQNEKFYHMGDTLPLRITYEDEEGNTKKTEWTDYTVGAVLYRPDEFAYEDIITVYVSPELFSEITGIGEVASYSVVCDDDTQETLDEVRSALKTLESDYHFTVTDTHEVLRQAKEQAIHTVLYIYMMKFFVLLVAVLLLISMSSFMLEVKAPSLHAMELIGVGQRQLSRINVLEFLIAAVFSSVVGIVLSLIGSVVVCARFDIPVYSTPLTSLLIALSMIFLTAVNVLIPVCVSLRRKA